MSDLYRYMYISYEVIICFGTILKLSVYLTAIARYNGLEINLTSPWNSTTHIFMLIHNTYLWYFVLKNISLIMILESVICYHVFGWSWSFSIGKFFMKAVDFFNYMTSRLGAT